MTPEKLANIVGLALALILAYLPFVKTWYDKLTAPGKATVAAGLTIIAAAIIYGLSCAGWVTDLGVPCTKQGIMELLSVVINTLIGLATGYITLVQAFTRNRI